MDFEPLISIIVPIFNAEKYLKECLESIINQTYKNIEILLINDGSSDSSLDMCKPYAIKDERIVLYTQKNGGVSSARNRGLLLSHGSFFTFIDSDDYIDIDYIEKYVDIIKLNNPDIIIGTFLSSKENNKNKKYPVLVKDEIEPYISAIMDNNPNLEYLNDSSEMGYSISKLFKSKKYINSRFDPKITLREDAIFNIQAFSEAYNISFLEYSGYHYRQSLEMTTKKFKENYINEIEYFLLQVKTLWERFNLPIASYNKGVLYAYMFWLKMEVLHGHSTYSKAIKHDLILNSFSISFWKDAFKNISYNNLSIPYKVLKLFYDLHYVGGIELLYVCSIKMKGEH
ncbi:MULTISPECIES: glycosyltransferase family 2 protein [Lactococcus]|uniref:glycosyltransferase family 2 protein n=1 Tax=Lactococcus TaxID=1357 RepID=UPI0024353E32|nr:MULTISPECIES: glycosyltransferase family 2 protein [Lactococcus]MDG6137310.1 glycosyltransferase family 2 protein [Lactococcus petauri]MDT2852723.1 glycosyltransferase family 2 protein [Lactococcus lactis]